MHGWIDGLLVGSALLASAVYAVLSLGPKSWKRGLSVRAAAVLRKLPGLRGLAARLQAASSRPAGTCGGCGDCAPAAPAARPAGAAGPEVSIPVSRIGKR